MGQANLSAAAGCAQPATGEPIQGDANGATKSASSKQEPFKLFIDRASELDAQRTALIREMEAPLRTSFGPDARLSRFTSVGGRLVVAIDGILPMDEVDEFFRCLQGDAFRCTEFARPDTREFRHHVTEYNVPRFRQTPLFTAIDEATQLFFPRDAESRLEVYRAYTNAVLYGDVAFVHQDSNNSDHVTALLYPNPEWSSELGGETIFYGPDGEIAAAVEPRPGRLVLFHGIIPHKGSPPSRLFFGSRYTTAFKFAPQNEEDDEAETRPRLTIAAGDTGDAPHAEQ
mmetsp:Transcript_41750/g.75797  ORF Transcript_41750/g.75797 Transcript_41750/m.75797 type:complete len:286 (-) Transcript_41750:24-881(-)